MSGSVIVPKDQEEAWSRSLGYLIWSMGTLEWQTYEWGFRLGGIALRDKLIDTPKFAQRQSAIITLIEKQNWPESKAHRARILWTRAKGFARFRNRIAHNPVIMNRNQPGLFFVVDARRLKGGEKRWHRVYNAHFVYQTAQKLQSLAFALAAIIEE